MCRFWEFEAVSCFVGLSYIITVLYNYTMWLHFVIKRWFALNAVCNKILGSLSLNNLNYDRNSSFVFRSFIKITTTLHDLHHWSLLAQLLWPQLTREASKSAIVCLLRWSNNDTKCVCKIERHIKFWHFGQWHSALHALNNALKK